MYRIQRESNEVEEMKERRFSDLGFRERDHLQEWIAKRPEILGEELLIIQKEFNGFSETNERLDLLALDKGGNLVVIENKLDDSGRDVVWQALKYASYCSTLSTSQVVKIYQQYVGASDYEEAKGQIVDFLDPDEDESFSLNQSDQRIIFVANSYRKEVTSTVLWLLNHDLKIQCFKATPHSFGDDLFLKVDQIIPVPELQDLMIQINEKAREDGKKSERKAETEADLLQFWTDVKARFDAEGSPFFQNIKAKPYFNFGFTKSGARFGMVIGRLAPRVELYFANDVDKRQIDAMMDHQAELQEAHGGGLVFERLEHRKASRLKFEMGEEQLNEMGSWHDPEARKYRIQWYFHELVRFYEAVYPVWDRVQAELASRTHR